MKKREVKHSRITLHVTTYHVRRGLLSYSYIICILMGPVLPLAQSSGLDCTHSLEVIRIHIHTMHLKAQRAFISLNVCGFSCVFFVTFVIATRFFPVPRSTKSRLVCSQNTNPTEMRRCGNKWSPTTIIGGLLHTVHRMGLGRRGSWPARLTTESPVGHKVWKTYVRAGRSGSGREDIVYFGSGKKRLTGAGLAFQ